MADVGVLAVLTLEEARTAVLATSAQDSDDELAVMVDAVSERMDDACGPIVIRSVTEHHLGSIVVPYAQPVNAWTSVIELVGTTQTTLTLDEFGDSNDEAFSYRNGIVTRRRGGYPTSFCGDVQLTFDAGRYATTEDVGSRFKQAAKIIIKHLWASEHGSGNTILGDGELVPFGPGWAVPKRAIDLLGDEQRIPSVA